MDGQLKDISLFLDHPKLVILVVNQHNNITHLHPKAISMPRGMLFQSGDPLTMPTFRYTPTVTPLLLPPYRYLDFLYNKNPMSLLLLTLLALLCCYPHIISHHSIS